MGFEGFGNLDDKSLEGLVGDLGVEKPTEEDKGLADKASRLLEGLPAEGSTAQDPDAEKMAKIAEYAERETEEGPKNQAA